MNHLAVDTRTRFSRFTLLQVACNTRSRPTVFPGTVNGGQLAGNRPVARVSRTALFSVYAGKCILCLYVFDMSFIVCEGKRMPGLSGL